MNRIRPMRFGSPLGRLRRDTRGTTAVEFGLLALPFFGLLFAIFEVGYVHFQAEALSGAVETAARAMLTGKVQTGSVTTSQQFVDTYLCPALQKVAGSMTCSNLIVDVRPASTFVAGDVTNDFYKSSTNQFCPGSPGQIVVMRVAYPLPAALPVNIFNRSAAVVSDVPGLSGNFHIIMGEAAFMEENFSGTYNLPPGC